MDNLTKIKALLASYSISNEMLALDIAIMVAQAERSQIIKDMTL
jgi:hypothetical protein